MTEVILSKQELDTYIGTAVEKAIEGSMEKVNDTIKGLRKDLISDERADELEDETKTAQAAFKAMSGKEVGQRMKDFRKGIFDGSFCRRAGLVASDSQGIIEARGEGFGKGELFQRAVMLYVRCRQNHGPMDSWREVEKIARANGHADLANQVERVLTAASATEAGAYIPEPFSMDFISALYSTSIVRAAGATVLDIGTHGSMTIPRQVTSANAGWLPTENTAIPASEGTYDQVKLEYKKLGVFVAVSNDAIRYALGAFDALVTQDMLKVAGIAEDIAFIRGDGTGGAPSGILDSVDAGNIYASNGADTYADAITTLLTSQVLVEGSDILMDRPAWLMATRTKFGLMNLRAAEQNALPFMQEMLGGGTIFGVPFFSTSHIPTNLGAGVNESELYYGEMSEALIGESMQVEVRQSDVASYNDGAQQNAFQQDETVIRVIHEVDFALRHPKAFSVATGILAGDELQGV